VAVPEPEQAEPPPIAQPILPARRWSPTPFALMAAGVLLAAVGLGLALRRRGKQADFEE
jgi:hypothetical protein